MLPSRLPLLQCEWDWVCLVISCWPWRQGGEGLLESQSAACGMSIQERSQEACEGKYWVWYLLGGPVSLRFFLHLISTIIGCGFFLQHKNFFSSLRIVMKILASFFSASATLCPRLSGREKQRNCWWDVFDVRIWFLNLLGIHNLECW